MIEINIIVLCWLFLMALWGYLIAPCLMLFIVWLTLELDFERIKNTN